MTCWVKRLCIWNVFSWNTQYRRAISRNNSMCSYLLGRLYQREGHGSIRLPGHAFLAWRSSWWWLCTFTTAAGNSMRRQLGSSCHGNRYCTERQEVRPVYHKSTFARSLSSRQPVGPPCWASPLAFGLIGLYENWCFQLGMAVDNMVWSLPTIINWLGCCPNKVTGGGRGWMRNQKYIYLHGTSHNSKNIISNI